MSRLPAAPPSDCAPPREARDTLLDLPVAPVAAGPATSSDDGRGVPWEAAALRTAPLGAARASRSGQETHRPCVGPPSSAAPQQTGPAPLPRPAGHDPWLLGVVLALCGFGVVMVYSASAVYARQKFGVADYFLRRDLVFTALGLVAFAVGARVDHPTLRRAVYPLLATSVALLAAVLFVGVRINGARRWFHLAGVSFQPAELAKLAVVLYLAHSLARKAEKVRTFTVGFLPHMTIAAVMMLLLLKQPDLGTAVILGLTTLLLLFVAGARVSYLLIALLAAVPVLYQVIIATPWRMLRILAYLNPWRYRSDVGYQITESLIAIGSGGLLGLGLGEGRQKLLYLPEAHTDYILAIVGEELGFAGLLAVAAAFTLLAARGARAALRAGDAFSCYLAFGITGLFALQAAVNFGVVLGSLPTKGLPLPFVSFGGSTLVVDLFAAGLLLGVSRGAGEVPASLRPSLAARLLALALPAPTNRRRGHRIRLVTPEDEAIARSSGALSGGS